MISNRINFATLAPVERGSGRCDPALNLALTRARQMAPDELTSAGYRDGLNNRGMLGSLCDYPEYLAGRALGNRDRLAALAAAHN